MPAAVAMLAPTTTLLWLLAASSLTSPPAPCLGQQPGPGLPLLPPPIPLLNTDDFDHAAFWEQLKKDWSPPGPPLRSPYGPQPAPRHPHVRARARPPLNLPEHGTNRLARLYPPWGDGFVRMPMQRQRVDGMGYGWRGRPGGPVRQPSKSTYPLNNGNQGGLAPNVTVVPVPSAAPAVDEADDDEAPAATAVATAAAAARRRSDRRAIPARDVAVGNPAAALAQPVPASESVANICKDGRGGKTGACQANPAATKSPIYAINKGSAYMLQLDVGTPPQRVWVMVDTGSYELWVNPKCTTSPDPRLCGQFGRYNPQLSSTVHNMTGNFRALYGSGAAVGVYYADFVKVAAFKVPAVQFAVADDSNYTYSGVLGLGYTYGLTTKYPTLLSMMYMLGFVAAPIFSIGLGGEGDNFSEIIFGGVNRFKFTGPLEPIEIWPPIKDQDPTWIQYWVNVTSIGISFPGPTGVAKTYTSDDFVMPMLIDTASTLSYIRADVVAVVAKQLNATLDAERNYVVDCALRQQNGTIDFGFNNGRMLITVSYRDFIWQQLPNKCLMGFQVAEQGTNNFVLGDTFLRGAYLVFDQKVDVVWMADYYNCGDGVQMVGEHAGDTQYVVGQC